MIHKPQQKDYQKNLELTIRNNKVKNIKIKIAAAILTAVVFVGFKSNIVKAPLAISKGKVIQAANNTCSAQIQKMIKTFKNKRKVCRQLKRQNLMMVSLQSKIISMITKDNIKLANKNRVLRLEIKYLRQQIGKLSGNK